MFQEHSIYPQCLGEWMCSCKKACYEKWDNSVSLALSECLNACGDDDHLEPESDILFNRIIYYSNEMVSYYKEAQKSIDAAKIVYRNCVSDGGANCYKDYQDNVNSINDSVGRYADSLKKDINKCRDEAYPKYLECSDEAYKGYSAACSDLKKENGIQSANESKNHENCLGNCGKQCGECLGGCERGEKGDACREGCYKSESLCFHQCRILNLNTAYPAAASRLREINECLANARHIYETNDARCRINLLEGYTKCNKVNGCVGEAKLKQVMPWRDCSAKAAIQLDGEYWNIQKERDDINLKYQICLENKYFNNTDDDCAKSQSEQYDKTIPIERQLYAKKDGEKYACMWQVRGNLSESLQGCCKRSADESENSDSEVAVPRAEIYPCLAKFGPSIADAIKSKLECIGRLKYDESYNEEYKKCNKGFISKIGEPVKIFMSCIGVAVEKDIQQRGGFRGDIYSCAMNCSGEFIPKYTICLEDNPNNSKTCDSHWSSLTDCYFECAKNQDMNALDKTEGLYDCYTTAAAAGIHTSEGKKKFNNCIKNVLEDFGGRHYSPASLFAVGRVFGSSEFRELNYGLRNGLTNLDSREDFINLCLHPHPIGQRVTRIIQYPWNCYDRAWSFIGSTVKKDK